MKIRTLFNTLPHHGAILQDIKHLNSAFVPVLEYNICFKPELGLCLQRMIESYNMIILDQFSGYYQNDSQREDEITKQYEKLEKTRNSVAQQKTELFAQQEMLQSYIMSKDREILQLQDSLQLAQKQLDEMRDFVEQTKVNIKEDGRRAELQQAQNFQISESEEYETQPIKYQELTSALNEYQIEAGLRQENLQNIQTIVNRLRKQGMNNQATQTDQEQFVLIEAGIRSESPQSRLQTSKKNTEYSLTPGMNEPVVNQNYYNNLPLNQQGGAINEQKFKEYHMRLNELLNIHKKKNKRSEQTRFIWATTNLLVMFLENAIQKFSQRPVFTNTDNQIPSSWQPALENYKPKLVNWENFKQLIFEILDHRIQNAEEIDGGINNTFMSFDEHLLIFLFDKHRTRNKVEKELLDFLASLKYYGDSWLRAKFYAQLLGVYQSDASFVSQRKSGDSATKLPMKMNDGRIGELDEPNFEIFQAEFYLHCFSLLYKDRADFLESKEGFTYCTQLVEEKVSNQVLIFMQQSDKPSWTNKLRRSFKKIKRDETDSFDTDFVDLDQLLGMYLEEFKAVKRASIKKIQKSFTLNSKQSSFQQEFSLDTAFAILKESRYTVEKISNLLKYTGNVTTTRAYLYALMTGTNNNHMDEIKFTVGCSRFGIDNPMPTIKKRLALYGNSEDVINLLKQIKTSDLILNGLQTDISQNKVQLRDMVETSEHVSNVAKRVAQQNIMLLSLNQNSFVQSPPDVIYARGIKIKVKDLESTLDCDFIPFEQTKLTNFDVGVDNKKNIIIPSFGTTSALFTRHFATLRQLKRRVELIKQSYFEQMDPDKCWEQFDQIISVLDIGLKYLGTEEVIGTINDTVYDDTKLEDDENQFNKQMKDKKEQEEKIANQQLEEEIMLRKYV